MSHHPHPRPNRVIFALGFAGTMASLAQAVIVPLLADLPKILNTTLGGAAWVVTITLLTAAVSTPIAGRLGDILGKKRVLLWCLISLVLGSVISALASGLIVMLIGRGLQGVGLGAISLGISLTREALPPARATGGIALISASLGLGGGLGLPLSAALVQFGSWRFMFATCAVLSVAALWCCWRWVPRDTVPAIRGRFDSLGAALLSVTIVGILLVLGQGGAWGWASLPTLLTVGFTALAAIGWVRWELRCTAPLVNVRVARTPRQLLTNAASLCIGVGMYASSVVTPQVMVSPTSTGVGLGLSLLATALWLLPGGLIQLVLTPASTALITRFGPKSALITGSLIVAVGYGLSMFALPAAWSLMLASLVLRAGVGIAYGAMPALIMFGIPTENLAATNSFNSVMRSFGTAVGAAVAGSIVAALTVTSGGHEYISQAGALGGLAVGCLAGILGAILAACIPVADMRQKTQA